MSQSDDVADDLKSMSFGSSSRSGSETVSTGSSDLSRSTSAAADAFAKHDFGASCLDRIRRLRSGSVREALLSPADVRFVRRLGSGDIGNVYLAELKCCSLSAVPADGKGIGETDGTGAGGGAAASPCVVAVKVMDRRELAGRNKEGRAKTEREILEVLDHPFLPRLYGCAENDRWSCLITEFCPGGDLHVLRQRQPGKRFGEDAVRFYAAEVVVALEYLHMMGIVYRDLKPENILVSSDGHIMLTDFDLSLKCDAAAVNPAQLISDPDHHHPIAAPSHPSGDHHPAPFAAAACILPSCIVPAVSCFNPKRRRRKKSGRRGPAQEMEFVAEPVDVRSMSFVGTHEYLAPEIVSGEGHGSAVDWWTLGVFVFELLYGFTPFRGGDNELTLANIMARALDFPKDKDPPVSPSARDLITGLLVKDPAHRMGAATGAAAVKRHPFFNGVNWALLRCAKPPYVPPPFKTTGTAVGGSNRDVSDDSSPGTPVDYY